MVVLRCTQKLRRRLGACESDPPPSTTVLGDWYVCPVQLAHRRFLLAISQNSRLAVLLPRRDLKHLGRNFAAALRPVLEGIGLSPAAVAAEVAASREAIIAPTNSRSHLGTLNDYVEMFRWRCLGGPPPDLLTEALWLSHTPVRPLGRLGFPDRVTRELFGEGGASGAPI